MSRSACSTGQGLEEVELPGHLLDAHRIVGAAARLQRLVGRQAAQAQLQLGRAYSLGGDLQQGINAYLRVAYLYPEAEGLVTGALRQAARNYVKLGKCPEALTVYTKLLEQTTAAQETETIQQEVERSGCQ